jgi:hypothetical protein
MLAMLDRRRRGLEGALLSSPSIRRDRKIETVGWRFQRRKKVFPGLTLNLGKRGPTVSVGRRGARVSTGRTGLTAGVSLLGTGLAYVWRRRRGR